MKKSLIKLGMSMILCSSLHAFDYNVVSGSQNLAAVIDIDDLSVFNKSSVDYIYRLEFSPSGDISYQYYDVNGSFPDKSNGTVLTSLKKGEGFILHANTADTISDTSTAIIYKGHSYYEVISPTTQEVWLDRNIGAIAPCSKRRNEFAANDDAGYATSQEDCFGDYYQWGRPADGHQNKSSLTVPGPVQNWQIPGTSSFILSDDSSHHYDWEKTGDDSGQDRKAFWARTDGGSVCPSGFRVPTAQQLMDEAANLDTMYDVLKFPIAGKRDRSSGNIYYKGYVGYLWSTDPDQTQTMRTKRLVYDEYGFNDAKDDRGNGYSVRCIKQ